jgi:hypothetical protein
VAASASSCFPELVFYPRGVLSFSGGFFHRRLLLKLPLGLAFGVHDPELVFYPRGVLSFSGGFFHRRLLLKLPLGLAFGVHDLFVGTYFSANSTEISGMRSMMVVLVCSRTTTRTTLV